MYLSQIIIRVNEQSPRETCYKIFRGIIKERRVRVDVPGIVRNAAQR